MTLCRAAIALATAHAAHAACASADWLVCATGVPTTLTNWTSGALSGSTLSNGLVSRSWITSATGQSLFGIWDFRTLLDDAPGGDGESLLRTLLPEATIALAGVPQPITVGGVAVGAGRGPGPHNFTLVANDSAASSAFVAQGPVDSLAACLSACWANAACNTVDWIPASDCVLKASPDPADPPLQPYAGCFVYATAAPAGAAGPHAVNAGPFLNRTGLTAPGALVAVPSSLAFLGLSTGPVTKRFNWTAGRRGSPPGTAWPPPGVHIWASFADPKSGLAVEVHYEIYDSSAAVVKWLVVSATPSAPAALTLEGLEVERLGLNPPFAPLPPMTYDQHEDDPAARPVFAASGKLGVLTDLYYATWANWTDEGAVEGTPGSAQPLLSLSELPGLDFELAPGGAAWTSARAYLLLIDDGPEHGAALPRYPASETYWGCTLGPCIGGTGTALEGGVTERRGLAVRRFVDAIAPQSLEGPLQNHLTASDSASISASCDAMATLGFEMLTLSYGSGADVESTDPAYRARVQADVAYCQALGIEVGAYDLIGWTRDPGNGWAALAPDGTDSSNACFASGWEAHLGQAFFDFAAATGLSCLETDGPYAGYGCTNASHQHTANNAVALQSRNMGALYSRLASNGIYTNAPDSWQAWGTSKLGIGYNEGTFRVADMDVQVLVQRQVMFDATTYTTPSAAWSQLPMNFNFSDAWDLQRFDTAVGSYLMMGISTFLYQIQGGPLLPTPGVAASLLKWIGVFKAYRTLLSTGDVIHVRRPNGQDIDVVVRARASEPVPGIVILTNPTAGTLALAALRLPLYYTGLAPLSTAVLRWNGTGAGQPLALDGRGRAVLVSVTVPARSIAWATVSAA